MPFSPFIGQIFETSIKTPSFMGDILHPLGSSSPPFLPGEWPYQKGSKKKDSEMGL